MNDLKEFERESVEFAGFLVVWLVAMIVGIGIGWMLSEVF